ncbi:glycoside hydrolase family 19 protein [Roseateles sp.]|uniref:glycoside hydrolase family 19 protein n=1 Tax=Roseateles sp. TaxID=1971397 RepID=UPI003BA94961
MPESPSAPTAPRVFTPTVLAWLGALGAAVAPTVQFINGYWQNQLKQTEIAHQIALDFAKLAIADKASREYRRDTLKVIASIDGNPLQGWARTELAERSTEQQAVMDALRSRLEGRRYTTLAECKVYLEQQLKVQSYLVAETFDRKDMKDTVGAAIKDDYTTSVERDCRDLETGGRPPPAVVVAAAGPIKLSPASAASAAPGTAAPTRVCEQGNGNPLEQLSPAKLARIYPRARPADLDTYAPLLRKGLARAEINTCARVAMFLAQLGYESGELRFTEELSSGEAYEGRAGLGNIQAGDGPRFKGRGLIQIVGRSNYQAFASATHHAEVMDNPALVATDPELALETALWIWTRAKLNTLDDDVAVVTRRLNGGVNGLEQRRTYLAAAKAVL